MKTKENKNKERKKRESKGESEGEAKGENQSKEIESKDIGIDKGKGVEKRVEGSASEESEWKENLVAFIVVIVLVFVVIGFTQNWWIPPKEQSTSDKVYHVSMDDDPLIGDLNAPVTIIEFGDYRSSACAKFQETTFQELKKVYIDTRKTNFVYRDFPMKEIHPDAFAVAISSECAHEQGSFWQFHDALYNRTAKGEVIDNKFIYEEVDKLNLNKEEFTNCLQSNRTLQEVTHDYLDGINNGEVSGTPTFFINSKKIVGNQPFATFQKAIEDALAGRSHP